MKSHRYRIVIIGTKPPKMLSEVTSQLSTYNVEIESISSLRLGHSFIALLMIETTEDRHAIECFLGVITHHYGLRLIVDLCTRKKFKFIKSNVFMRVRGKYNINVNSSIIATFTRAGLDIHGLETDTYSKNGEKFFVINIKGFAKNGVKDLMNIAHQLEQESMQVAISDAWELLA